MRASFCICYRRSLLDLFKAGADAHGAIATDHRLKDSGESMDIVKVSTLAEANRNSLPMLTVIAIDSLRLHGYALSGS